MPALEIRTATSGTAPDPDGYTVAVDGGTPRPIGVTDTLIVDPLPPGVHGVALAGLAAHCAAAGENPATATVARGATTVVEFVVACAEPPQEKIAFTTNAVGLLGILVVNPDGTGLTSLTPEGTFESNPVWSPDGRRILFADDGLDLHLMNADGTRRQPLTSGREVVDYRWSPDGSRIGFTDIEDAGDDIVSTLWVMAADGSGALELARDASGPTWSPDSRRIAYTSTAGRSHIRVVDAAAGGDRRLTDDGLDAFQPAWSPAADEIAFVTLGGREILLIGAEGGEPVNLTQGQAADEGPAWSPDGARIAFTTAAPDQPLESEIAVMSRDGSGRTVLTSHVGFDFGADWSPDGARIVFVRSEERGELLDSEIYVIHADGSGELNLSNRPDTYESSPDWGGSGPGVVASRGKERLRWLRAGRAQAGAAPFPRWPYHPALR